MNIDSIWILSKLKLICKVIKVYWIIESFTDLRHNCTKKWTKRCRVCCIFLSIFGQNYFIVRIISWPTTMWGPAVVVVCVVCLSVCHTHISPKLSEIDVWLLGNSNKKPGFPVENLPSGSWLEVQFCQFGCFRVGTSPIQTKMGRLALWM